MVEDPLLCLTIGGKMIMADIMGYSVTQQSLIKQIATIILYLHCSLNIPFLI